MAVEVQDGLDVTEVTTGPHDEAQGTKCLVHQRHDVNIESQAAVDMNSQVLNRSQTDKIMRSSKCVVEDCVIHGLVADRENRALVGIESQLICTTPFRQFEQVQLEFLTISRSINHTSQLHVIRVKQLV